MEHIDIWLAGIFFMVSLIALVLILDRRKPEPPPPKKRQPREKKIHAVPEPPIRRHKARTYPERHD